MSATIDWKRGRSAGLTSPRAVKLATAPRTRLSTKPSAQSITGMASKKRV